MRDPITAYPVPFTIDRSAAPRRYELVNTSTETLDGISLTHLGTGYSPPLVVRRLEPGRGLSLAVFGAGADETGVVIVRWRRPDRGEFLWRMSLASPGLAP
ncbi:hypothetical protein [Curtobacterium sp. APC 4022]|uniref:hypothetical protein n=1 Tax=Curtobacterium sp. APC 4022 TaxID=3035201 RepID=UPI0025B4829B|nr:hypothetical protein [Curtobacterium sp. APC 4022]MDN3478794.1 hypothetical protein [Curtobacterium sp. APC 4022]